MYDLWRHEVVGEYTPKEIETFGVKNIPGHGQYTFKFMLLNIDNAAEDLIQQ